MKIYLIFCNLRQSMNMKVFFEIDILLHSSHKIVLKWRKKGIMYCVHNDLKLFEFSSLKWMMTKNFFFRSRTILGMRIGVFKYIFDDLNELCEPLFTEKTAIQWCYYLFIYFMWTDCVSISITRRSLIRTLIHFTEAERKNSRAFLHLYIFLKCIYT